MKCFNTITCALREIKEKTKDFTERHESLFLFIDYWGESFYVTDDIYEISEKLEQTFFENGCEPTPETLASESIVFEYSLAINKEVYPFLYKKVKKPAFKTNVDLIRRRMDIEPEYSLDFNIGG